MSHLGERLSALVDGQLPADVTERTYAHIAGCEECREALESERRTKALLSAPQDPVPSPELVQRLKALGGPSGPLRPRPGRVPGSVPASRPASGRPESSRPESSRPGTGRPSTGSSVRARSRSGRRRTGVRAAVAALGATCVLGLGGAFVLGGQQTGGGTVVPPVAEFTAEHATTSRDLPLSEPAAGMFGTSANRTASFRGSVTGDASFTGDGR